LSLSTNWRENQALGRRLKIAKLRHNVCIEDIDYRAARGQEKTVIRGLAKDSQWVQNHENLSVLGPTVLGILDRLVHNAHRIEMRNDSMRKNRGKPNV
jgi:DNA replication protein DnaC